MKAVKTSKSDVKKLAKREQKSHKGDNGKILIIAGSKTFHGAAIFAGITASRLVDLVFFATAEENLVIVKKASPAFIVLPFSHISVFLEKADTILIGPGLEKSNSMRNKIHSLLKLKKKKFVLDATALRLISPKWLHANCVVTPHSSEFKTLFKMDSTKENVLKAAKKYNCIVVLKGKVDYISDGKQLIENHTGNSGMTAGGTGDILSGLIAGFAAKNPLLLSAKAACYLNGYAAKLLKKENGNMWNAKDLMGKLPEAKKRLEK